MNKQFSKFVVNNLLDRRSSPAIKKHYQWLEQSQWFDAEKIREIQWQKVQKLLDPRITEIQALTPSLRDG